MKTKILNIKMSRKIKYKMMIFKFFENQKIKNDLLNILQKHKNVSNNMIIHGLHLRELYGKTEFDYFHRVSQTS